MILLTVAKTLRDAWKDKETITTVVTSLNFFSHVTMEEKFSLVKKKKKKNRRHPVTKRKPGNMAAEGHNVPQAWNFIHKHLKERFNAMS